MTPEVKEVLDTFRVAARIGTQSLGAYIISMAQCASDVLCVELLQREARLTVSGRAAAAAAAAAAAVVVWCGVHI
jgi:phosphoenolpyruvate carboxylase